MLLLSGGPKPDPNMSEEEKQQSMKKYLEWLQHLMEKGILKAGNPLGNEGIVLSSDDGVVTDGPFTETKESIGGYFILQAQSLEEAVAIARTNPHLMAGGKVEVRQVLPI